MAELSVAEEDTRHQVGQGSGIKLFGTMIVLKPEEEEEPSYDHKVGVGGGDPFTADKRRPEKIIPCPRCKSMETKFCYFNNYNVNQPRHFCRGCQRYWTAGGALRNVPVGAGRRKSKPLGREQLPLPGYISVSGGGDHCLLAAAAESGVQHFDDHLDGVVVQEWRLAVDGGGFWHDFQAKRRRRMDG
ncbi:hypothetical protein Dimus_032658 [Dionaea muscipula]